MINMTDKYYTPEKEEFHIGFEYELLYLEWEKRTWQFHNFSDGRINAMIAANVIRVKYLDKEDIESLGWKLKIIDLGQDTSPYPDIFSKDSDASWGKYYDDETYGYNIELLGSLYRIKNKSELKKLCGFLNIVTNDK